MNTYIYIYHEYQQRIPIVFCQSDVVRIVQVNLLQALFELETSQGVKSDHTEILKLSTYKLLSMHC